MEHHLLVAARSEYTEQLQDILGEGILHCIRGLWNECKLEHRQTALREFQKKLCSIPEWNQEVIIAKCKKMIKDSDVTEDYLDKIIEAVFLSNVKILSVVKLNDKKQTINVSVPDTRHFIHRCHIEAARRFYSDPYLIDDRDNGAITQGEIQRNIKRSQTAIRDSIEKTIRGMIPMEDILTKYLDAQEEEVVVDKVSSETHDSPVFPDEVPEEVEPQGQVHHEVDEPFYQKPEEYQGGGHGDVVSTNVSTPQVDLFESRPEPTPEPQVYQPQTQGFQPPVVGQQFVHPPPRVIDDTLKVNLKNTSDNFFDSD
jgi:hypothetical protein